MVQNEIANFTIRVPDTRYQIPDTRYQIPDTRYQIPDTRYLLPVTCYLMPDTGYWVQGASNTYPWSIYFTGMQPFISKYCLSIIRELFGDLNI